MSRRSRLALSVLAGAALLAGVLTLADALGLAPGPDGGRAAATIAPRPAPPTAGRTLTGTSTDLSRLRGHPVVVTVWASWCPPCRDELPVLAAAQQRYGRAGVAFLGVLTRDSPAPATALLAATGANGLTSVQDPDGALAISWGVTGVPETFVVDGTGMVRARRVGPVSSDWLAERLDPMARR